MPNPNIPQGPEQLASPIELSRVEDLLKRVRDLSGLPARSRPQDRKTLLQEREFEGKQFRDRSDHTPISKMYPDGKWIGEHLDHEHQMEAAILRSLQKEEKEDVTLDTSIRLAEAQNSNDRERAFAEYQQLQP